MAGKQGNRTSKDKPHALQLHRALMADLQTETTSTAKGMARAQLLAVLRKLSMSLDPYV